MCGIVKLLQTPVAALVPKIILYVTTKDMAWKLYSHLLGEGVSRATVEVYHASLTLETKSRVYQDFKGNSGTRCVIATVAFGMVCCSFFRCNAFYIVNN